MGHKDHSNSHHSANEKHVVDDNNLLSDKDEQLLMSEGLDELKQAASALFRIPVFFSHPSLRRLNTTQTRFIIRLFNEIKKELFFPRTLPNTEQYPESLITNIRRIVLSSYGLVAANLKGAETPFLQIEPSMAYQYGLPMLLIKEEGAVSEGFWEPGIAPFYIITWFSGTTSVDAFFSSVEWKELLNNWASEVRNGYYMQTSPEFQYSCSGSEERESRV